MLTINALLEFCTKNNISIRIDPEDGFDTVKFTLIDNNIKKEARRVSGIIHYNIDMWRSEYAYEFAINQFLNKLLFELYNGSSSKLSELEFYRLMFDNRRE